MSMLVEVNRSRTAAAGVDPGRYAQVVAAMTDLGRWPEAFVAVAREHLEIARRAEAGARSVSAAQAYRDASLWFHFAACVPDADADRVRAVETNAARALRSALSLEPEEATYTIDGRDAAEPFVALVQRPARVENPPMVLLIPGLDSSKEEFQAVAAQLRMRGMATVSIDGPGQGEVVGVAPPQPRYERVVAAVLERLDDVQGVDLDRVAAIGLSLGGYYVARAAAFEPRITAAVAVTGPYSLANWDALPVPLQTTLTVRANGHDARDIAGAIDLSLVAASIRQPLLVVCGEKDPVVSPADMHRLAAQAPGAELLSVPDGDHLCANSMWAWLPVAADWLAAQLGATTPLG